MKGLLLILAVIATSSFAAEIEQGYSDAIRNAWHECRPANMTDKTYHDMTEGFVMPKSKDEKCFKYCLSEKLGHMKGNKVYSKVVKASNKKLFTNPKEARKVNKMWETCLSTVGKKANECDTSTELTVCLAMAIVKAGMSLPTMAPAGPGYKYKFVHNDPDFKQELQIHLEVNSRE